VNDGQKATPNSHVLLGRFPADNLTGMPNHEWARLPIHARCLLRPHLLPRSPISGIGRNRPHSIPSFLNITRASCRRLNAPAVTFPDLSARSSKTICSAVYSNTDSCASSVTAAAHLVDHVFPEAPVRADVSVSAAIPVRGPAGRIDSVAGGGPALRLRAEPECSPEHAVP
jgi:hypothetical protein